MSRSSVSSSDLEQHTVIVVGRSPRHLDVDTQVAASQQTVWIVDTILIQVSATAGRVAASSRSLW